MIFVIYNSCGDFLTSTIMHQFPVQQYRPSQHFRDGEMSRSHVLKKAPKQQVWGVIYSLYLNVHSFIK